jgi:hypothetical protein
MDTFSSTSIFEVLTHYCAGDKIEKMKWARHVARKGEGRDVYRVLVGRPLGRPRHRWEDNIKMELQEVGCGGMGLIELGQDGDRWRAVMNAVLNLRVS